jgi:hypothetical protein
METKKRNSGIKFGLIAGIGLVLFSWVLYRGGVEINFSWIAYLGYVISIGLAMSAVLVQRKANGGMLEFQAALKTAFTVLVFALAAQTLFSWILLNWVDVPFKNALDRATLIRMEASLKLHGMPDDERKKYMDDQHARDAYSLGSMIMGLALSCIVQFIIALLIAAVLKKKKNE